MGRAFEYRRGAKEKRWAKMSKLFPKLGKAITIAAKSGGPDPTMNSHLRTAIQNAKAENMPKDKIDAAIKRASGKDADTFTEVSYEAKWINGVQLFIECATDNPTRTVANVKAALVRAKPEPAQLLNSGALEFMFNRKSVIEIENKDGLDIEELELELIDAGLEEIEEHEGIITIYGDYKDFGTLTAALEEREIEAQKATLQRIATSPISISDEDMDNLENLLDKLEDDEDVQAVYTNLA